MKGKITVVGSINYDVVVQADRLPAPGETVNGGALNIYFGGKGSNQAVQAALLGCAVSFVGRTGDDEQGEHVQACLAEKGVDIQHLAVDQSLRTGCAVIYVDPDGKNMIVLAPGANKNIPAEQLESARDVIEQADLLISQNEINQDAIMWSLRTAKEAGVLTVFNPAPAVELPDEAFSWIDYFIPNETEADYYTGLDLKAMDFADWTDRTWSWFRDKGVENLVVTLGSRGSMAARGGDVIHVPALEGIKVMDTTAAGDSFIGGFSASLAAGLPIEKALYVGNVCGGLATTVVGAQNSIHDLAQINRYLKAQGQEQIAF